MIRAHYDYEAPTTIAEARSLVARPDAAILAGGQSLLTELKLGQVASQLVVDLRRIPGLTAIGTDKAGNIRCGAMVTLDTLAGDAALAAPSALIDALAGIADPQVRNRATIGGSVVLIHQGADLPAVVLALAGTIELTGPDGTREVGAATFLGAAPADRFRPGEIAHRRDPAGTGTAPSQRLRQGERIPGAAMPCAASRPP